MNLTYIIGTVAAFAVMIVGMMFKTIVEGDATKLTFEPGQIENFFDASSIMIVIGCTLAVIVSSFPPQMLKCIPKHFKIMLNTKKFDPMYYIDQLAILAQLARKDGLLSLEEKANEQSDPFFKQAIMLIVDANDPDKVRGILTNDIERMVARHDDVASMYEKAAGISPAFGMLGTLVGLINMLKGMDVTAGDSASSIGGDMSTALITTLYGVVLANIIFSPIASNLRTRDEEEVLCKMIIIEGIMSIQSGESPKFLKEKLLTYMAAQLREEGEEGGKGKKAPKEKKEKKGK